MSNKITFRIASLVLAAAFVFAPLTGCGASEEQSATQASSAAQETKVTDSTAGPAKKDVAITYAASQNWVNKGTTVDSDLNDAFTKETGIKVDMQVMPDDQYANVLKTKLSSGEVPDVFMVGAGVGANKYFPDKYFADLSGESWVARYEPYAKSGTTINGKVMGLMTWCVDGWGLLYNTSIFDKYNLTVPKTFEELTKTCDILKSNNITPIYEIGKESWHWAIWLSQFGPAAAKNNAELYSSLNTDRTKFAEVKEFETFLAQLKQMYDKGYLGKNSLSNAWDSAYEAMGKEQAAMILMYTSYQGEVAGKYPDSKANEWKMFPIPLAGNDMFAHSAGGIMRVAYKDSKNLDSVKEFFNFLTRPENLKTFYEGRADIQASPSFTDVEGKPTEAGKSIVENAPGGDGIDMEFGVEYWDNTVVGKYIQELVTGGKTPAQVLEAIDKDRSKMFAAISK